MRRRWIAFLITLGVVGAGSARLEQSGSVERLVELAHSPDSIVVDEATGRVFVAGRPADPRTSTMAVSVLDTATGSLLRTLRTPLRGSGAGCCRLLTVVDGPAGRIYLASNVDDRLLVLDAGSGAVRAIIPKTWVSALLPLDPLGRMLVVTQGPSFGGVRVLDGRSGATLASFPCPDGSSAPFQDAGLVVYRRLRRLFVRSSGAAQGAGVCIIDPLVGHTLSRVRIGPNTLAIYMLAVDERTARVFVASHDTMGTDADPDSDVVTVLDAHTGRLLRTTPVGPFPSGMVIASGHVFVLNSDDYQGPGSVSILDASTGRLLRTITLGGIAVSLTLDDVHNRVVVGLQDGRNQGLDARTGRVQPLGAPGLASVTLGVDPATHRAFTTPLSDTLSAVLSPTRFGIVQVRDTRTWSVLRTVSVAGTISAPGTPPMAIDTRRHRGFVPVEGCRARAAGGLAWLPGWLRRRLPGLAPAPSTAMYRNCVLVVDTAR